jgi:phosphate uptake regulator
MERHFEHDLEELKQRLLWMGSLAERAVHQAVHAVLDAEENLADSVLTEESAINAAAAGAPTANGCGLAISAGGVANQSGP